MGIIHEVRQALFEEKNTVDGKFTVVENTQKPNREIAVRDDETQGSILGNVLKTTGDVLRIALSAPASAATIRGAQQFNIMPKNPKRARERMAGRNIADWLERALSFNEATVQAQHDANKYKIGESTLGTVPVDGDRVPVVKLIAKKRASDTKSKPTEVELALATMVAAYKGEGRQAEARSYVDGAIRAAMADLFLDAGEADVAKATQDGADTLLNEDLEVLKISPRDAAIAIILNGLKGKREQAFGGVRFVIQKGEKANPVIVYSAQSRKVVAKDVPNLDMDEQIPDQVEIALLPDASRQGTRPGLVARVIQNTIMSPPIPSLPFRRKSPKERNELVAVGALNVGEIEAGGKVASEVVPVSDARVAAKLINMTKDSLLKIRRARDQALENKARNKEASGKGGVLKRVNTLPRYDVVMRLADGLNSQIPERPLAVQEAFDYMKNWKEREDALRAEYTAENAARYIASNPGWDADQIKRIRAELTPEMAEKRIAEKRKNVQEQIARWNDLQKITP